MPAGLPSSLLERKPDIRAAEAILEAQGALARAAKATYFPRINLTGLFGFQNGKLVVGSSNEVASHFSSGFHEPHREITSRNS